MDKLIYSPVVYNDIDHTYTLGDTTLKGITGMIGRQLFPDKYSNVPEGLLRSAAEKGKAIHAEIEMLINGFNPSEISDEAMAFSIYNVINISIIPLYCGSIRAVDLTVKVPNLTPNLTRVFQSY